MLLLAGDIVIFGASLLQGQTYEFTAALDTRQIIELIRDGDFSAEPDPVANRG